MSFDDSYASFRLHYILYKESCFWHFLSPSNNIYLPIIMLTTSFIFAPFPTSPKKNALFPKTSKAGTISLYSACNKIKREK